MNINGAHRADRKSGERLTSSDEDVASRQNSKAVQTAGQSQGLVSLAEVGRLDQQIESIRTKSDKARLVLTHLEAKSEQETAKIVAKYMEVVFGSR